VVNAMLAAQPMTGADGIRAFWASAKGVVGRSGANHPVSSGSRSAPWWSTADSNDVKWRKSLSGADYAASLNAPTSSNQGCTRFHLGQIWATTPSFPPSIGRK
jgi:hypothetical protein